MILTLSDDTTLSVLRFEPGQTATPTGLYDHSSMRRLAPDNCGNTLVVMANERPVLAIGVRERRLVRAGSPLRLRRATCSVVNLSTAGSPQLDEEFLSAAVRCAARELLLGPPHWNYLSFPALQMWMVPLFGQIAAHLGYGFTVNQSGNGTLHAPETDAESAACAIFSDRLKGRLSRVLKQRSLAAILGAVRPQQLQPTSQHDSTRFFTLELSSVVMSHDLAPQARFREVLEPEICHTPEKFSTDFRRMEEGLRRGDRCFVAMVDGHVVHHKWLSIDRGYLSVLLPAQLLERKVGYVYDAFTVPEFRGRRLQAAASLWLADLCRKDGLDLMAARVSASNEASIRGFRKAGYTEVKASPSGRWSTISA